MLPLSLALQVAAVPALNLHRVLLRLLQLQQALSLIVQLNQPVEEKERRLAQAVGHLSGGDTGRQTVGIVRPEDAKDKLQVVNLSTDGVRRELQLRENVVSLKQKLGQSSEADAIANVMRQLRRRKVELLNGQLLVHQGDAHVAQRLGDVAHAGDVVAREGDQDVARRAVLGARSKQTRVVVDEAGSLGDVQKVHNEDEVVENVPLGRLHIGLLHEVGDHVSGAPPGGHLLEGDQLDSEHVQEGGDFTALRHLLNRRLEDALQGNLQPEWIVVEQYLQNVLLHAHIGMDALVLANVELSSVYVGHQRLCDANNLIVVQLLSFASQGVHQLLLLVRQTGDAVFQHFGHCSSGTVVIGRHNDIADESTEVYRVDVFNVEADDDG